MTKTHTTLSINAELIDQAKKLKINISKTLSDSLESIFRTHDKNIDGINIKLEKIKLETAIENIKIWQRKLKISEEIIKRHEELQKEKEEQELMAEKERIESAKRCDNCKEIKGEQMKMHAFGKKQICNKCFMSSNPEDIKKWIEK